MLKIKKEAKEMAKDLNNLVEVQKDMEQLRELKAMISQLEEVSKAITNAYLVALEEAKLDSITTEVGTFQHAKTGVVTSYDYAKYLRDNGIDIKELDGYTKTSTRKAHVKFIEKKVKGAK